jgi:DHA1 family bicyclomycin/chloramphenicol resistance-like MFS transporter
MPESPPSDKRLVILILGSLMSLSPFAIDMYLPAFPQIARDFGTTPARVALSVSSYFIGLAAGQLLYGPLLDRFGRKHPLYAGLFVFIIASLACTQATTVETLVILRFFQAAGGCVAWVAAMTLVRDLFPVRESVRIFSLLVLILGLSPLLAPTVGGFITEHAGWVWVFLVLAILAVLIFLSVFFFLPGSRSSDPTVSLRPGPMLTTFFGILRHPQFYTYTFSGAFSFASLFIYVAGSPVIFMEIYGLSPEGYGGIFALISVGFIGASQLNILLVKRFPGPWIFRTALTVQLLGALLFLGAAWRGCNVYTTIALFFVQMSCVGIINPNASGLALAPFTKNVGSASALIGCTQIGIAALVSSMIGIVNPRTILPIVAILSATTAISRLVLWAGERKIGEVILGDEQPEAALH